MKKVLIYPDPKLLDGNLYLFHLAKVLTEKYQVLDSSSGYFRNVLQCNIILLNWFESIPNSLPLLIKRVAFLSLAVCMRKRIIWTIHNKMPHDGLSLFSKIVIFLLLRLSSKIHVLCRETFNISYLKGFEKKCVLVPHGDYFGDFKERGIDLFERYGIDRRSKIVLFSGAIRPYKNIELLIQSFVDSQIDKKDFVLLIRGSCSDVKYVKKIENVIGQRESVIFDPTFIPTSEMFDYLNQSICLVAPYQVASALNSGTLWMALSYKKTMIIPRIGSVMDIPNDDFLYTYSYTSEEDHKIQLEKAFCRIEEDFSQMGDVFKRKGQMGYEYMMQKSWSAQKEKWLSLFS